MSERDERIISRNTGISVGLGLLLLAGLLKWSTDDASWRARIDARLQSIEQAALSASADRWRKADHDRWAAQLKAMNPDLVVPGVDN